MTEETFNVGHINCAGCERAIRTLLGDVDGIQRVEPTTARTPSRSASMISASPATWWWHKLADIGYAPKEA